MMPAVLAALLKGEAAHVQQVAAMQMLQWRKPQSFKA
jgi:hypothetical protein